jgi:hypothetical protein
MHNVKARKERELPDLWQVAFDDERRVVASCLLFPALMSRCGGPNTRTFHQFGLPCRLVRYGKVSQAGGFVGLLVRSE